MVDKAYLGMPIEEFKRVYKEGKFIEEPVHEYGVDGESMGLKVVENGEPVLFVWTFEGDDKVSGITVLSPKVTVDSTIYVGATASDFFKRNPSAEFEVHMIDERFELGYVKGKNYTVEFLTTDSTRVGNYEYGDSQPKFLRLKRPDAKIDRITIENK
ncbi:hypothetical protein C8E01_1353 [Pontibacter virosus]|uniref:Uncharacterized protein n=2 Tax=Pontibacter virosus TaxID=1765052 RepID=A0A2U1AGT7_9BACT|nr:hypothetical protein C8E01_1353 [Pontibacter virosus]